MFKENMFDDIETIENASLKDFSTVKIGGNARFVVFPKNVAEVKEVFKIACANNLKTFVVGNGSNVLFSDNGFDGVVISLKHFCKIKKVGDWVWCGAGAKLFALHKKLIEWGLSGFEWSYGIPATIGGLTKMNAGCFGHEISELIESVVCFDDGKLQKIDKNALKFGYRWANFGNKTILWVKLQLKKELPNLVEKACFENFAQKQKTQPLNYPSLGSVFKRCEKDGEIVYPAKLIDNLGLKGVKIGGAEISKKHAGFVVNVDNATSKDFLDLVKLAEVECAKCGISLCREIIVVE